jgi:Sulfatase-modifying factor enzyme 1
VTVGASRHGGHHPSKKEVLHSSCPAVLKMCTQAAFTPTMRNRFWCQGESSPWAVRVRSGIRRTLKGLFIRWVRIHLPLSNFTVCTRALWKSLDLAAPLSPSFSSCCAPRLYGEWCSLSLSLSLSVQEKVTPLLVDKYEVNNAQFAEFMQCTGHVTDAERYGWSFCFEHHLEAEVADEVTEIVQAAPWWFKVAGADWQHPEVGA